MSGDFAAFRVLVYANPMNTKTARLICDCLDWYERHCGLSVREIERALALYKLKMEKEQ